MRNGSIEGFGLAVTSPDVGGAGKIFRASASCHRRLFAAISRDRGSCMERKTIRRRGGGYVWMMVTVVKLGCGGWQNKKSGFVYRVDEDLEN